jgi:hypothetical protein
LVYISFDEGVLDLDLCQERMSTSRHDDPVIVYGPIKTSKTHQSPFNASASIDGLSIQFLDLITHSFSDYFWFR